jgi:hypothetical protein
MTAPGKFVELYVDSETLAEWWARAERLNTTIQDVAIPAITNAFIECEEAER